MFFLARITDIWVAAVKISDICKLVWYLWPIIRHLSDFWSSNHRVIESLVKTGISSREHTTYIHGADYGVRASNIQVKKFILNLYIFRNRELSHNSTELFIFSESKKGWKRLHKMAGAGSSPALAGGGGRYSIVWTRKLKERRRKPLIWLWLLHFWGSERCKVANNNKN